MKNPLYTNVLTAIIKVYHNYYLKHHFEVNYLKAEPLKTFTYILHLVTHNLLFKDTFTALMGNTECQKKMLLQCLFVWL